MRHSVRTNPALLFLALITTAALALGACGGDDKEDADANAGRSGSGPSSPQIDRNRALLESLGTHSQTVIVREYVTTKGGVGREYGVFGDVADPQTTVSVFYRDKLKAQGWETTQEQAAVSVYGKGGQTLSVMRYGPTQPVPAADQTTTVTARHSVELKFFFAVEAA